MVIHVIRIVIISFVLFGIPDGFSGKPAIASEDNFGILLRSKLSNEGLIIGVNYQDINVLSIANIPRIYYT